MDKIKVLVVDDHPIVREGLKLIFDMEEMIEITDEATNGEEALGLLRSNSYDLILLDISMPVMDGLQFLKKKEEIGNETNVIILTTVDDRETIKKAMEYGVKSFLLKDASREDMLQSVLAASRGEPPFLPKIKEKRQTINNKQELEKRERTDLTEKEIMVLGKIIKGAASKEIAIDMGITERTVKAHLTSIYRKLKVNSRTEAVAYAITRKIVRF